MSGELDNRMMARAIELSRRGFPAPNPHVGCLLAHGEKIVGEGWHEFAGGNHAETAALKNAGGKALGATAYVTLEPCNHHGRTPPCSQALIEAGCARVVIACLDPNPQATGGVATLRSHSVEVEVGVLQEEAADANRIFRFAQTQKRPYVILKAAITLDGFIAREDGTSKWITSEAARLEGHRLRAEAGCVLVGRETVERDNPELTARIEGVRNQPRRAVLDPKARLTGRERVLQQGESYWYVATDQPPLNATTAPLRDGRFDLEHILADLFSRGEIGVLVEGGGQTIRGFLEADLADELHLFVAPKLFGSGRPWGGGLSEEDLSKRGWQIQETEILGPDAHLVLRRMIVGNKK